MKKYLLLLLFLPFLLAGHVQRQHHAVLGQYSAGGEECSWSTVWEATAECTGAENNTQTSHSVRAVVLAATTTGGGSKVKFTFEARSDAVTYPFVTDCVYFGPRDSGDVITSATEITFNTGQHGFTINTNNGTITSDEITYAFSGDVSYLVTMENCAGAFIQAWTWDDNSDTECRTYYDGSACTACSNTLDYDSDNNFGQVVGLQKIEACN